MITAYKYTKIKILLFGPLALLLVSCGSYEYAGYENDGIYSPDNTGNEEAYTAADYEEHEDSYEEALYYKKLFGEKSEQFGEVAQEGLIFTDVENYTSTGSYDDAASLETDPFYTGGHGAWGSQADRISVNIYNDGFYSPFYHPYHNPFYSGYYPYRGYGYGWNDWGWNHGFGYGGYGYGYGGYAHYNPWRWNNVGWHGGLAYNSYRYGGYYSSPYYFGDRYAYRDVTYNQGRRSSVLDFDDDYNRSNSTARASRIDYSDARSARVDRGNDNSVRSNRSADDRTYRTRTTRVESPRSERRSTYRRSNDSDSSPVRVRSTRRSRSNNDTYTRSRSTSRSSGTVRSSSGSTRSSGTTRSSSRSSRGRGR